MHTITIDLEKCTGCKKCYQACFVDVIRFDEKSKKAYAKYPEECALCCWCELRCPADAIKVAANNPVRIPEPFPATEYPKTYVRDL
jgi:NAD-dependent dihydropyrimidine dehydrogenase PreA subunit